MKVRNGFVSNSSSSSFIIAVKKTERCPHCGRSDVSFIDIIETIGSHADDCEQTQLKAKGAEQVFRRIEKDTFEWCNSQEKKIWQERLGEWLAIEEKGYEIADIEISYHDEATDSLFTDLRNRKSLFVLWSDQGNVDNIHLL